MSLFAVLELHSLGTELGMPRLFSLGLESGVGACLPCFSFHSLAMPYPSSSTVCLSPQERDKLLEASATSAILVPCLPGTEQTLSKICVN